MSQLVQLPPKELEKRKATCAHFNGIQHSKCEIGIRYAKLSGDAEAWALRIPCLGPKAVRRFPMADCAHYRPRTEEEVLLEEAEWRQQYALLEMGYSPCCGEKLVGEKVQACPKCQRIVAFSCTPGQATT